MITKDAAFQKISELVEDYNGYQITDGRYKYTIYELPGYPEILTDLQINPGETITYKEKKILLKKELLANLTKRGLIPLSQDRTIQNIRKLENEQKGKKGKAKLKIREDK